MTRRIFFIASLSLAREHSSSIKRNLVGEILKEEASSLSAGSNPNLFFNLNHKVIQLPEMVSVGREKIKHIIFRQHFCSVKKENHIYFSANKKK